MHVFAAGPQRLRRLIFQVKEIRRENRGRNFYAGHHASELDPVIALPSTSTGQFYSQWEKPILGGKLRPSTMFPIGK
jgi:hypothetical protein